MKYRPDIDGLRAVAVLPVVFFHAGVPNFSGGFVGVDVFFVISGYVITRQLKDDLAERTFSIAKFYERRIRRIFPALFFTVALTWAISVLILLPGELVDFSKSAASLAFFSSNLYFWRTSGYFDASSLLRPLLHTWTLCLEEQYYIFMPIAMYVGHRWFKSKWALLFLPVALASFALSVLLTSRAPAANFFLLPTRAWELLLGAILILCPPRQVPQRLVEIAAAVGIALIAYAVVAFSDFTPFPGANALFPCLGAAILLHTGAEHSTFVGRWLSCRPAVWIGLISYSLYLVHWPITVFARYYLLRDPGGYEIVCIVLLSLVLAVFSWRVIESPFRKAWPEGRRTLVFGTSIAALAATFLAGVAGVASNGFPFRFPDYAEQKIAGYEQWGEGVCFLLATQSYENWNSKQCVLTSGNSKNLLLWGDSFAAHYVPGLISNQEAIAANVIQYTAAGCPPILSYYSFKLPNCQTFNRHALELIEKYDVKYVVMSARWDLLASRGELGLQNTISAIRAMGAEVVVIAQSPEFSMDVQSLAYRTRGSMKRDVSSWKVFEENPLIAESVRSEARQATLIEPMGALCSGSLCPFKMGDEYLYLDYGHFSSKGSDQAVRLYFPLIDRSAPNSEPRNDRDLTGSASAGATLR
ncbi:Peptidoglycan/LPS O-acetylase OafA/YrhL, contains acyltransferase and SGNH-hydrolase domains [Bradyrhizobium lablabi]|uniref:Peptidoglycan/LPS O-acetylase OafA/YrhL, contains acyltransferase and SGNH-hydrolase domains n=1 Tax=Bradyrhizobium lablabi TaxID=722472 RepID=A0A1M6MP09_9BRAD|nr:acyltransferase family protein [Bradyrhizobium lablabi]SHJ85182.1 Peptidoglycan/LPS O-acetylase OafA/YrhL, contains acyltransferase and SGNH-hydrolase domains [Bradyrhizobium lablabi]